MECIELNWLCKDMTKVRNSQAAIVVTDMSKTFSLWVSLNECHRTAIKLSFEY